MGKLSIEVHLAHACNLSCQSCSHYSNYHFSGTLSLGLAESWYQSWCSRVQPWLISLLGGEPTINPYLSEHLLLARRYWPTARIRLVTNGILLHKHPQLPGTMKKIGNTVLDVSKHYNNNEYEQMFQGVLKLVREWQLRDKINVRVTDSFSNWTQRYEDKDGALKPFTDNDPRRSWEICRCKTAVQLHEGKLWKCPILAYLPMAKGKRSLGPEWNLNLGYRPLEPGCSNAELNEFIAKEDEPFCAMCPAYERKIIKNNPLQNKVFHVSTKNKV